MEAATQPRDLSGDKAQRIVRAMRGSVALRGTAGSTFDHVAREAGVSRGLLHYYFGTKEALLIEVVRRDCDIRIGLLDAALAEASTADDFITALVGSLDDMVSNDPEFLVLLFELFVLARRNDEIAGELRELFRRTREHVAGLIAAKEAEGVLQLQGSPEAIAEVMFSMGDGVAMRMLLDPERDYSDSIAAGVTALRSLLTR